MADSEQFNYNGAKAILEGRGLLAEIEEVVKGLSFVEKGSAQVPRESPKEMSVDELMKLPEKMAPALQKLFVQRLEGFDEFTVWLAKLIARVKRACSDFSSG